MHRIKANLTIESSLDMALQYVTCDICAECNRYTPDRLNHIWFDENVQSIGLKTHRFASSGSMSIGIMFTPACYLKFKTVYLTM